MADEAKPPPADTVRGPRGDEFEVLGRAGPVRLRRAPRILAEAAEELLVVKEGRIFVCSGPDGDIQAGFATGEGLYADDTRYLSELRLRFGGKPLVLLSSHVLGYAAAIDLTNPDIREDGALAVPQMTLNVQRVRLVSDRLYERIEVRNHGSARAVTELEATLAADFADMFEVRGFRKRTSRGQALAPKRADAGVAFAYVGEDETFRQTLVELDPEPTTLDLTDTSADIRWPLDLAPRESITIEVMVEPSISGSRRRRRSFDTAETRAHAAADRWRASCTEIQGPNPTFNGVIGASIRDLRSLAMPVNDGQIISAGIPWYVAPFGRDALVTCYEMMMMNPEPAREALQFLARHQARADDSLRDAEPGKILHELRVGELAGAGYIPHTPYYGTVDATPLFLMLASAYYRWTADLETLRKLRPALDAAVRWIDEYGDRDGDGFVEYERRSPAGLENQGWKDSEDAVVHADGSRAEGPIALVEVQGYVYLAKLRIADVYEALGEPEAAEDLRKQAATLKEAFNEAFWMPDEGTFAMALDGRKEPVRSVTSNPGHALYCGIAEPSKAEEVAVRLMAPDMFSGWGVRTLSSECPAYNPMSYHNGSVWPHDNAIIAAGLKRYGFVEWTEAIATALFDAATVAGDLRLPELFCGFRRREGIPFVRYPVACRPQAWAAAAPFMALQAMLGISARAEELALTVIQPNLPSWLGRLELRGLRVADSTVGLAFGRDGAVTSFSLVERHGDVAVNIRQ